MRETAARRLEQIYNNWLNELKVNAPFIFEDKYSNPDFMSIPEKWFDTTGPRIMVVGEERFGEWGNGKRQAEPVPPEAIATIQQFHKDYLESQLEQEESELNTSAFWRRFRRIAEYGLCSWTNIDKFHVLGLSNCALSNSAREKIHSVDTKILFEEIAILNPTHIVFFGWHGESLKYELPELYKALYPTGKNDSSVWKNNVVPIEHGGRTYIFAYHPNRRSKAYEDKVLEVLLAHL